MLTCGRVVSGVLSFRNLPQKKNLRMTWQWKIYHLNMYFLLKVGIFQPAKLVFGGVVGVYRLVIFCCTGIIKDINPSEHIEIEYWCFFWPQNIRTWNMYIVLPQMVQKEQTANKWNLESKGVFKYMKPNWPNRSYRLAISLGRSVLMGTSHNLIPLRSASQKVEVETGGILKWPVFDGRCGEFRLEVVEKHKRPSCGKRVIIPEGI